LQVFWLGGHVRGSRTHSVQWTCYHSVSVCALAERTSLMLHRAAAKFKALRHKRRHAIPDVPVMPDVAMTDAVQPVLPQISAWRAPVCHGEPMLACRRLIENSQAQV